MNGLALPDLAQAIEREHQSAFRASLGHAIRCGELLIEAKKLVGHGAWLPWIRDNLSLKPRLCQAYMRLASKRDELDELNAQALAHLGIEQALEALAEPRISQRGFGSESSVEWYTPAPYIESARHVLDGIDVDPASSDAAQRVVQAKRYFTAETDGLSAQWLGSCWLNSPYARKIVATFVAKLLEELSAGRTTSALLLTNAYSDNSWWHEAAAACQAICFTKGRIYFTRPDGERSTQPNFGSSFFYFGPDVPRFREAFSAYGLIMLPDTGAVP
jgi:hypothetical protein